MRSLTVGTTLVARPKLCASQCAIGSPPFATAARMSEMRIERMCQTNFTIGSSAKVVVCKR
jgi:hypothetical protein